MLHDGLALGLVETLFDEGGQAVEVVTGHGTRSPFFNPLPSDAVGVPAPLDTLGVP